MNRFFLLFEDLLDKTQKSVAGPFSAESREDLVERFGLQRRKNAPQGCMPNYWDGKKAGEVVIYIILASDPVITGSADLQNHAFQLQCGWY